MKKILVIACTVVAAAFSLPTMAGGYKSAGCGLGSMLIKDDGFVQVFAATTNNTFDSQTFGITSGTSNCGGSGGTASINAERQMYVEANHDAISQEIVQGSGEHLTALASLMGCDKNSTDLFTTVMKQNYRSIAGKQDPTDMLNSVKATISSNPNLAKACNG